MSALDQADDLPKIAPVSNMVSRFLFFMTVWAGRIWDCRGVQALPLSVQRPEAVRPELSSKAPLERLQLVARPDVVCNLSSNATILGQEPLSFSSGSLAVKRQHEHVRLSSTTLLCML